MVIVYEEKKEVPFEQKETPNQIKRCFYNLTSLKHQMCFKNVIKYKEICGVNLQDICLKLMEVGGSNLNKDESCQ